MLLRHDTLEAIRRGEVTLAFRRWRRPTVKSGGQLKTRIGVLDIVSVERIDEASIDDAAARQSGHPDRASLFEAMAGRKGDTYRIELAWAGPDPRIALRQRDAMDETEWARLIGKLDRMDAASKTGPWTSDVLALIDDREAVRAADLAAAVGEEKLYFKARVRRLKALGLTESLKVGYRLSPRGRAVLARRRGE